MAAPPLLSAPAHHRPPLVASRPHGSARSCFARQDSRPNPERRVAVKSTKLNGIAPVSNSRGASHGLVGPWRHIFEYQQAYGGACM
jgi:hypothetical protein